jgi:DNA-binding NarL/FixJ family response regulator
VSPGDKAAAGVARHERILEHIHLVADDARERAFTVVSKALGGAPQHADLDALPPAADVLVLSLAGPPSRWVAGVRAARAELPHAILVCLLAGDDFLELPLLREGANAVIDEDAAESMLSLVVEAARNGYAVIPVGAVAEGVRPLSTRERQILGMVVMGLSNGEIARKLHITEHTVKSHLSSSFAKLRVRTRSEAAAKILSDGGIGNGILGLVGPTERLSYPRRATAP